MRNQLLSWLSSASLPLPPVTLPHLSAMSQLLYGRHDFLPVWCPEERFTQGLINSECF